MLRYDAFVSYSHADEREIARRLQEGIEKFGKPWYRTRSLRLFLDTNSLTASPGLWASIERALAESRWLVLVTSPRAADSPWIDREIRWWLEHRSPDNILIVVAEGQLQWDSGAGDFNPDASTALPTALLGSLKEQPHWVAVPTDDGPEVSPASMRKVVIDIAAPLKGVSKEKLVAAADREHRRAMRWVRAVILVLSLLLIAAVGAGVVAFHQRSTAEAAASLALSRQVASASEAAGEDNLSVAMLLAVQAYRIDANAQTRRALFGAVTDSPNLVRFLDAGGEVKQLVGSANGSSALAALADGRVLLWVSMREDHPRLLLKFPEAAESIAISRDGSVIAAAGAGRCLLWRRGRGLVRLSTGEGLKCDVVSLSPSGKTVVYQSSSSASGSGTITVSSVAHPLRSTVHPDPDGVSEIVVPSDRRAVLVSGGTAMWRSFSHWRGSELAVGQGAHDYERAISGDGRLFIVSNGSTPVPILRTTGKGGFADPDYEVDVPLPNQTTVALSPDGSELAVAGPGQIYVAPVDPDRSTTVRPGAGRSVLSGQTAGLVTFAGDSHLLSAAKGEIAVWNTHQLDRLARVEKVPLAAGCTLCGPPKLSVSPDGRKLAAVNDPGDYGFVARLDGTAKPERLTSPDFEYEFGTPVWKSDGQFVAIPLWPLGGGTGFALPPASTLPPDVKMWQAAPSGGEEYELAQGAAADGETAYVVDEVGRVFQQGLEDGAKIDATVEPASVGAEETQASSAAVSPSGRLVAIAYEDGVHIEELPSRDLVAVVDSDGYGTVAFAGDRLLVENSDGDLEVWSEDGSKRYEVIGGGGVGWLTGSPDGRLAAQSLEEDGTVRLLDLENGSEIASFRTPEGDSFLKTGLAFSPDGSYLLAVSETRASWTSALVSRDISDASLVRTACAAAGHELRPSEWRTFVGTDPPADLSCR